MNRREEHAACKRPAEWVHLHSTKISKAAHRVPSGVQTNNNVEQATGLPLQITGINHQAQVIHAAPQQQRMLLAPAADHQQGQQAQHWLPAQGMPADAPKQQLQPHVNPMQGQQEALPHKQKKERMMPTGSRPAQPMRLTHLAHQASITAMAAAKVAAAGAPPTTNHSTGHVEGMQLACMRSTGSSSNSMSTPPAGLLMPLSATAMKCSSTNKTSNSSSNIIMGLGAALSASAITAAASAAAQAGGRAGALMGASIAGAPPAQLLQCPVPGHGSKESLQGDGGIYRKAPAAPADPHMLARFFGRQLTPTSSCMQTQPVSSSTNCSLVPGAEGVFMLAPGCAHRQQHQQQQAALQLGLHQAAPNIQQLQQQAAAALKLALHCAQQQQQQGLMLDHRPSATPTVLVPTAPFAQHLQQQQSVGMQAVHNSGSSLPHPTPAAVTYAPHGLPGSGVGTSSSAAAAAAAGSPSTVSPPGVIALPDADEDWRLASLIMTAPDSSSQEEIATDLRELLEECYDVALYDASGDAAASALVAASVSAAGSAAAAGGVDAAAAGAGTAGMPTDAQAVTTGGIPSGVCEDFWDVGLPKLDELLRGCC